MAAEFSTQGTERSMPPPMMTKVWPSATMPTKAASTSDRAQVRGGEEARREERGDEEEHDHPDLGEQDQPVAGEEARSCRTPPRRLLGERAREHRDEQDHARHRPAASSSRRASTKTRLPISVRMKAPIIVPSEVAAAAEEADAADHRRGDRGEDVVLADGRRAGAGLGGEVERGAARRRGRRGRR